MSETPAETIEQPIKESKLKKFGPALFWGGIISLPAMNLAASYFGYRDTKMQLELAKLQDAATDQAS